MFKNKKGRHIQLIFPCVLLICSSNPKCNSLQVLLVLTLYSITCAHEFSPDFTHSYIHKNSFHWSNSTVLCQKECLGRARASVLMGFCSLSPPEAKRQRAGSGSRGSKATRQTLVRTNTLPLCVTCAPGSPPALQLTRGKCGRRPSVGSRKNVLKQTMIHLK